MLLHLQTCSSALQGLLTTLSNTVTSNNLTCAYPPTREHVQQLHQACSPWTESCVSPYSFLCAHIVHSSSFCPFSCEICFYTYAFTSTSGLLAHTPAAGLCVQWLCSTPYPAALPLRTWIRKPLTCLLHAAPASQTSCWTIYQQKSIWQDLWGYCCLLWTVESKKMSFLRQ